MLLQKEEDLEYLRGIGSHCGDPHHREDWRHYEDWGYGGPTRGFPR